MSIFNAFTNKGDFPVAQIRQGFQICLPVAISAASYGMVLGVLASAKGLSVGVMTTMSLLVFAGSSQFVAVDMWLDPLPVGAIIVATLVMNFRYLLICASLGKIFEGRPLLHKILAVHLVTDENWAVTMTRKDRGNPAFLIGGGVCLMIFWQSGVTLGQVIGNVLPPPEVLGLDFAFSAAFIAIVASMWKGKADILPWAVAALFAIVAERYLPGKWYVIVGALSGSITAVILSSLPFQKGARHDTAE
ncbi:MAG: AzlC family ABC transporter permease [Sneathiella sp.]